MTTTRNLKAKKVIRTAGLMTGTSMDGLDISIADIGLSNNTANFNMIGTTSIPYPSDLQSQIRQAVYDTRKYSSTLDRDLGKWYAEKLFKYLQSESIDNIELIGSHGQTIHHVSGQSTLQIGDPSFLAGKFNIPVISDFRTADICAGGTGAPLMPRVDEWLFRNTDTAIITLNLGGIANVTLLPCINHGEVIGFDTGPGMALLDETFIEEFKEGIDIGGKLALEGNAHKDLVNNWLKEAYFFELPPKSTGRDQFGINWLADHRQELGSLTSADQLATLSLFTTQSVFLACEQFIRDHPVDRVIVSGGGTHHGCIIKQLVEWFNPIAVTPSNELGVSVDGKEALGFAILAVAHVKGIPGNIPSVTGAKKALVLGKMTL
ncbi:MAG: anhydro-N-acetylmuramic acid kinase [Candidatus Neomarinimicrobiota bacterium]